MYNSFHDQYLRTIRFYVVEHVHSDAYRLTLAAFGKAITCYSDFCYRPSSLKIPANNYLYVFNSFLCHHL